MKQVTITIYSLNELQPVAKEVAIIEHANFLMQEHESVERQDVIDSIETNEYLFYYTGEIADTTALIIDGSKQEYLTIGNAQFKILEA